MNVLVTGGTGFIGRHLCERLADSGHEVTALARDPEASPLPDVVETVRGDVTAYDSVVDSFAGQDVVYNLVALSPLFEPKGGNEMHEQVHLGGTENCVRAAREHDIDHFVQMSALGADPDGQTHYIRSKGRAENIVTESSFDWTIFRPSVVFGDGGQFLSFTKKVTPPVVAPLPGGGRTRFQPIHVDDMATMLADTIEDDRHRNETYEIGGPEQLTLADLAELVRGESVTVIPVPMELAGVGLSIAGAIPGFPMGRDQYRSLQFDNTTADNDIDAFGYDPTDLLTVGEYLGVEN
ncbi:complex I NDUFA9 subunit family protein [Halovenus salina]|uniref:complex I NDUFA9 subunit family protein n=1 Tax=Halovenus salina TaxID=1510225 RepID=UPI002260916D|nr:complex I NDUFA9 subunit family protein [Halovenus salina]